MLYLDVVQVDHLVHRCAFIDMAQYEAMINSFCNAMSKHFFCGEVGKGGKKKKKG